MRSTAQKKNVSLSEHPNKNSMQNLCSKFSCKVHSHKNCMNFFSQTSLNIQKWYGRSQIQSSKSVMSCLSCEILSILFSFPNSLSWMIGICFNEARPLNPYAPPNYMVHNIQGHYSSLRGYLVTLHCFSFMWELISHSQLIIACCSVPVENTIK